MHSTIFQITEEKIPKSDFIDESTFEQGNYDFYDYCTDTQDDERMDAINNLVDRLLPTDMFSLDENDKNIIVYNGGAEDWKNKWVKRIQQKAKEITSQNVTESIGKIYHLEQELINPLDIGSRFVTENYQSSHAQQSGDFMKMICKLEPGTELYFGGILDFHW